MSDDPEGGHAAINQPGVDQSEPNIKDSFICGTMAMAAGVLTTHTHLSWQTT